MRKDLCLGLLSTDSGPENIIKVICGTHNCQLIYIKSLPDYSKCSISKSSSNMIFFLPKLITVLKHYAINAIGAVKNSVLKLLLRPSVFD